jgi:hypothetical protein
MRRGLVRRRQVDFDPKYEEFRKFLISLLLAAMAVNGLVLCFLSTEDFAGQTISLGTR